MDFKEKIEALSQKYMNDVRYIMKLWDMETAAKKSDLNLTSEVVRVTPVDPALGL